MAPNITSPWALACLAAVFTVLAIAPVARADVMMIPALSFVPVEGTSSYFDPHEAYGLLRNPDGRFNAAVLFPNPGWSICAFTLYVNNLEDVVDVTARLLRKHWEIGHTFTTPTVIAVARTTGVSDGLRPFAAPTITAPVIQASRFYFVEIYGPAGTSAYVLGVSIVHKPEC